MSGYTKLFSSIVGSTIWGESNETKILWITMLAIADKYGEVSASLPGLAQLARLNLDEVTRGIDKLMSPDKYSRTKDYEGRRIKEIDGGWLILNHGKYREKMNEDERREKNAEYQRRFRRKRTVSKSNGESDSVSARSVVSALSAHAEAEADPESDSKAKREVPLAHSPLDYSAECDPMVIMLQDGPYSVSGRWQVPTLVLALRDWSRHMMAQGMKFQEMHMRNLLMTHESAGWTAERLERGIRMSISKSVKSTIIDPQESTARRSNGAPAKPTTPIADFEPRKRKSKRENEA